MNRRNLIKTLGGATLALTLGAKASTPSPLRIQAFKEGKIFVNIPGEKRLYIFYHHPAFNSGLVTQIQQNNSKGWDTYDEIAECIARKIRVHPNELEWAWGTENASSPLHRHLTKEQRAYYTNRNRG